MVDINKVFEMFKEMVSSPELKELIIAIQEMYNQKEELQQRINKAIDKLEESQKGLEEYHFDGYDPCLEEIINILKG